MSSRTVSEVFRKRSSLFAVDADPTTCTLDAAFAASATVHVRRASRTASAAPITRAKCMVNGNPCRSFSRTPARRHPTWRRSNATALPPGSRHSKSAGRAPIAARLFHGMRRSATNVAIDLRQKRMRYPAGRNSCAVSCFPWRIGKERRKGRRLRKLWADLFFL